MQETEEVCPISLFHRVRAHVQQWYNRHLRFSPLNTFFEFLSIYLWPETWIVIGSGALVTAVWTYFTFALDLPNPIRAILIWGLFVFLIILVTNYNPKGKRG